VSTENAALSAQLAALDIQVRRITASVLLIKALGGDWNAATPARTGLAANNPTAAP
jgi:outer membrane protein TolC